MSARAGVDKYCRASWFVASLEKEFEGFTFELFHNFFAFSYVNQSLQLFVSDLFSRSLKGGQRHR